MKICTRFAARALAAAGILACAAPALAATATGSFGVSATVVAACTVAATPWTFGPVCLPSVQSAAPAPGAAPVVHLTHDAQTGALVQIVEF